MKESVCYEPNKGPAWKWILIAGLMLLLYPVAWVLGKLVGKQRAAKMIDVLIPDL